MDSFLLLRLGLLFLTQAAAGHQSLDHLVIFALLGDDVTLPCSIPTTKSCSSVNWKMTEEFLSVTEVVKAGRVTAPSPKARRLDLLKNCSLRIINLVLDDALIYSCDSGAFNSSVSLKILNVTENSSPADGTIELECFLNTYRGYEPCNNNNWVHIKWSTENNTPLNGKRFRFEKSNECFSKMIITKKPTDHRRTWKCQLTQNDTVKAAMSYTTTIKDGTEEVFAVVGESASLSCGNTSFHAVRWAVGERILMDHVTGDSSLVIGKVSAQHAGDYQCSESSDQQMVLNKIRLHTLDVTSEIGRGGANLTMTCVLTCNNGCSDDFNLTWSGGGQTSWQSGLRNVSNTLINRLFLPVLPSDELTCFAQREGDVMTSKKWRPVNPLETPLWVLLPLALLICAAAAGLYMYRKKKKHNKAAGNEQPTLGLHVYETVEYEQGHQEGPTKAVTTTDSFYDLLQAVN